MVDAASNCGGERPTRAVEQVDAARLSLVGPQHLNEPLSCLELTGPEAIDYFAVASAIGKAAGREVTYVPVLPADVGEAARRHGTDDWTANVTVDYCTAYARGWGDFTTDHVLQLSKHAPRSIADFARELLAPALR